MEISQQERENLFKLIDDKVLKIIFDGISFCDVH
jgi:hypothetical protein